MPLTTTELSICWSLVVPYQAWPRFVYTNLQIQNSFPSRRHIKTCWRKFEKLLVVFIVFTCKAVVDENFVRKSTNICKSIVAIDASQLYPNSMCQHMHAGLNTHWDLDPQAIRLTPRQNKTRSFEKMVVSFSTKKRDCKIESYFTTDRQKKLTASVLIDFVLIAGLCFKAWAAIITFVSFKKFVRLR